MNIIRTRKKCWNFIRSGQPRQALNLAKKLVRKHPKESEPQILQGQLLFTLQHYRDALSAFTAAAQLQPESPEIFMLLGQTAQELGDTQKTLDYYGKALALEPTAQRMSICGNFLLEIGQLLEAEQLLTIAAKYGDLKAVAGLVLLRLRQSRAPEAADIIGQYLPRLSEEPALIQATARLMLAQKEYHSALEALEMLDINTLSTGNQLLQLRLLGETFDKLALHQKAFVAYQQCNTLRALEYNSAAHQEKISSLQARFSDAASFEPISRCSSERIVFIVGMPRSGSSLLEQILSMHPAIYAAGELDHMPALIKEYGTDSVEALDTIAKIYLERISSLNEQALIITDKLPHNYIHLGDIARIFPKARVIYTVRDPLDTGWSCYRQNFHSSLSYATDLWSIGHFHARLQELMETWKAVLPLPILEIHYEDMVQNLPKTAHQILDFCGLDWHDNVLNFHQSTRAVHTASSLQVRQPLYTSSIGNSIPYAQFLQPLKDGLSSESATLRYPPK